MSTALKIAHLSDIHNGYRTDTRRHESGVNLREHDGDVALSAMVTDIIDNEVDIVLIAGDLFHSPFPTPRNIFFVQNQLRRFYDAGIKVYTLAGNHDTNDIASDIAASKLIDDPLRGIYSYATPYERIEVADGIHLHMISHHMYSQQSETMKDVKTVDGEVNILSTHGSVIDPILHMRLSANESPREVVIPDPIIKDQNWSYTLLGHIHERGWVGSMNGKEDTAETRIYYNGSLIRRGFSDAETPLGRGWTLWTVDSDGNFSHEMKQIAQRPQYDFPIINARDLTPKEITEKMISNLQSTQIDGTTFNPEIAPILRQKIQNITPAKKAALDFKSIDTEKQHAFSYKYEIEKLITEKNSDKSDNGKKTDHLENIRGKDILEGYDLWKDNSVQLSQVAEVNRDAVAKASRAFIKMGHDEVLNSEGN